MNQFGGKPVIKAKVIFVKHSQGSLTLLGKAFYLPNLRDAAA